MSTLALELIEQARLNRDTFLDLGNCGLTELPESLMELTWLEKLSLVIYYNTENQRYSYQGTANKEGENDFSRSNLTKLKELSQLKALYLVSSNIKDISTLGELTQLKTLDLSYNNKIKNSHVLGELTQLQILDLSWASIQDISALGKLTQLEELDLSFTNVQDITVLGGLSQLKILNLGHTDIQDISSLSDLVQLETLELGNTKIQNISALSELVQLKTLTLYRTTIEDIKPLGGLTQLEDLDLSESNNLTDISALRELPQLKMLDLSEMYKLPDISVLGELDQLETLYLVDSDIRDLTPLRPILYKRLVWDRTIFLDGIYVGGCPIETPPRAIAKEGVSAILNYFREIDQAMNEPEQKQLQC